MRFLHTGDWHVGKTLRGRSRAEEHRAVLEEIIGLAGSQKVNIALVAGDLFDSAAPTPESEKIVYEALLRLSQVVEHVVLVSGNHDNPRRLEAIKPLLELTNIHVGATLERPDNGGVIELQLQNGELAKIALFPFLSQRAIVRADQLMTLEPAERSQTYQDRASKIIEQLCSSMGEEHVNVLVGHSMLHGGKMGGGERSAHTVFEYSIPTTAFPPYLHYAAMGHLHRPQKIPGSCPIHYSGSPLQLDFGETEDVKVVNIVDAESGRPAMVRQETLRHGKRLRTIRGTLEQIPDKAAKFRDDYLRVILDSVPQEGFTDKLKEEFPQMVEIRVKVQDHLGKKGGQEGGERRLGRSPVELFTEYLAAHGGKDENVTKLFSEILEEVYATDQT